MMRISAVAVAVAAEAGPQAMLNFKANAANVTQAYVASSNPTNKDGSPWMQISLLVNGGLLQLTSSQTSAVELPHCAVELYKAIHDKNTTDMDFMGFMGCAQQGMKHMKDGTTEIKWFASLHEAVKDGACEIDPTEKSYPHFTTLTAGKDGKTLTAAGKGATKLVLGLDGPAIKSVKLSAAKKGCWNGARVVFGNNAEKVAVEKFADLHPTLLAGDMKTKVAGTEVYKMAMKYLTMMMKGQKGVDVTKAPFALISGDIEAASLRRA